MQTLRNIKNDYEAQSLKWQTKWRYVIFVIIFVLLIVLALLAGSLGVGFVAPRVTAFFVILLWIFTIITMVVGAGEYCPVAPLISHAAACIQSGMSSAK